MFSRAAGREAHCKRTPLACVGSAHSVWAAQGLPRLTACALSRSTLLRLQVALLGSSLRQALGCVHFPGLSCSGSWALHKCSDLVGPTFCALPSQVRAAQATRCLASSLSLVGQCILSPPWSQPLGVLGAQCSVISGVPCVSSGELISGCGPAGGCQPSMIPGRLGQQLGAYSQFGGGCRLWGRDCPSPPALAVARLPLCLWRGMGQSAAS